jgi:hypothetical protein
MPAQTCRQICMLQKTDQRTPLFVMYGNLNGLYQIAIVFPLFSLHHLHLPQCRIRDGQFL